MRLHELSFQIQVSLNSVKELPILGGKINESVKLDGRTDVVLQPLFVISVTVNVRDYFLEIYINTLVSLSAEFITRLTVHFS